MIFWYIDISFWKFSSQNHMCVSMWCEWLFSLHRYVPLCSTGAAIVLCLHAHAIVPQWGWGSERLKAQGAERSTVCTWHVHWNHRHIIPTYSYICVSMGMALNVTGALPTNWEDLYVNDNNSVITGFYSIIYMADCIRFIYQCMESVQCFIVDENGVFYNRLFLERLTFLLL